MTKKEAKEAIKEAYGNSEYTDEIIKALEQEPILDKIRAEIVEEKDFAYSDFDRYKIERLGVDEEYVEDDWPQDDFRCGMERAIEIIELLKADRLEQSPEEIFMSEMLTVFIHNKIYSEEIPTTVKLEMRDGSIKTVDCVFKLSLKKFEIEKDEEIGEAHEKDEDLEEEAESEKRTAPELEL